METDKIALNEVQVVGMDTNKKLQETAAPVALRTLKDFERTSKISFMPVLNSKLGYKKQLGSLFVVELYAGIDNILDETYTSRVALNATGFGGNDPAFFDPALDRNFYSGISLKYSINQ